MPVVVSAESITFSYGDLPVLDGISFPLEAGEFVAIAGPNGSGKSTLVRIVLGLLAAARRAPSDCSAQPPDRLDERWRIGYVPQRPVVPSCCPPPSTRSSPPAVWPAPLVAAAERPTAPPSCDALDAVASVDLRHGAGWRVVRRPAAAGVHRQGARQPTRAPAARRAGCRRRCRVAAPVPGRRGPARRARRHCRAHLPRARRGGRRPRPHHRRAARRGRLRRRTGRAGGATACSLGVHDTDLPVWLEGLE